MASHRVVGCHHVMMVIIIMMTYPFVVPPRGDPRGVLPPAGINRLRDLTSQREGMRAIIFFGRVAMDLAGNYWDP